MSSLLPFLTVNRACEQVDKSVRATLTSAGMQIVQTFDLQIARLAHPDCSCPHHGTEQCSCQLVVLLVYGKQQDPATLVLHGQDGKTWISLATPPETRTRHNLESSVRYLLIDDYSESIAGANINYGLQF